MSENKYERDRAKKAEALRLLVEAATSSNPLGAAPVAPAKVAPVRKVTEPRKKRAADTEIFGRRTSSRNTAYAEDGTKLSRDQRQAELEAKIEREQREEDEAKAAKSILKHSNRPVEPLRSVTGSGGAESLRILFNSLASPPSASSSKSRVDQVEDTPATRAAFRKEIEGYKQVGLVKLVPERIYSLAVHPSLEHDVVVVGDKKGCIGIWDRTVYPSSGTPKLIKKEGEEDIKPLKQVKANSKRTVKKEDGEDEDEEMEDVETTSSPNKGKGKAERTEAEIIKENREIDIENEAIADANGKGRRYYWQAHMWNSVSCVGFCPNDPGSLYSGAYDCTVRRTNFKNFETEEVINADTFGSNNLIHSFSFSPDGNEIWVTDANGGLMHRDLREPIETTRRWEIDASGNKVGGFSICPANPYLAISSHLKKFALVWDLKKLMGMPSEATVAKIQTCVLATFSLPNAITAVHFDKSGTRILMTSYDDRIRVFIVDPLDIKSINDESFVPATIVKHDNQTGAYVSVFKAVFINSPTSPPAFLIGAMKTKYLQVYTATDGLLIANLIGNETTSVPAVVGAHPTQPGRLYGGTGAGKVVCFT